LYVDAVQSQPFSGTVFPTRNLILNEDGTQRSALFGNAVRNSSPLTSLGFERGLAPIGLGGLGPYIVLLSVFLFALSTAISWSYYGDRCANYLFGLRGILPYKMVYVLMHFIGATLSITTVWDIGDTALSLVTLPNVLSLILLSGVVKSLTNSYFERKPWLENYEVHQRIKTERHRHKPR
jgi:AGCS family alanine or glycine:cation symporter